ncbi:hypothetical protein [Candidatus Magnetominusculus xianensis]|uniref:Uncharacterized protein n=1 Tax=Candidatus Magnetominusculus xianensis TaxID=1748249 RepID=A0ABR5SJX2_9BACT|nr:hypothetical protein [Candidatus Magnetominusculus xianensis]KWT91829.1 hypothetical protein ASN18_0731 [Candidatus Magnetominusculus xianensis]MBF0403884.1 hypothetical protein [Nitrospirota bacterium]
MTLTEIVAATRSMLDDTATPYLWPDEELVVCLNDRLNVMCAETLCITDSTTPQICTVTLTKGLASYALDSRIIAIKRAALQSTGAPLFKTTQDSLFRWYGLWQNFEGTPAYYLLDVQSAHITLHPVPAASDTINLTVYRLPLSEMSTSTPGAEPEIPRRYSRTLINGILALAYEKSGSETLNTESAKTYRELWQKGIDEIKREALVNGSASYSINDLMGVI